MDFTTDRIERMPVALPNGATIQIEVSQTGREDVALDLKPFRQVTDALEGIIDALAVTLHKARPSKATVKFGLEVGIEAGQLTAVVVKGAGKANLEITLEWATTPGEAKPPTELAGGKS